VRKTFYLAYFFQGYSRLGQNPTGNRWQADVAYLVIFFLLALFVSCRCSDWTASAMLMSLLPALCKMERSGFLPASSAGAGTGTDVCIAWNLSVVTGLAARIDLRRERWSTSFTNEPSGLLLGPFTFLPNNSKQQGRVKLLSAAGSRSAYASVHYVRRGISRRTEKRKYWKNGEKYDNNKKSFWKCLLKIFLSDTRMMQWTEVKICCNVETRHLKNFTTTATITTNPPLSLSLLTHQYHYHD